MKTNTHVVMASIWYAGTAINHRQRWRYAIISSIHIGTKFTAWWYNQRHQLTFRFVLQKKNATKKSMTIYLMFVFSSISDFGSNESDIHWFWPVVWSHDYEQCALRRLSDDSTNCRSCQIAAKMPRNVKYDQQAG